MRIWIGRLFGGRAPQPEPVQPPVSVQPAPRDVAESTTEFGVPVTYMRSDVPEIDSAFGYGHLDGRRGVEPENFREFISHTADGEGLDRLVADLRERESQARTRAESIRQQRAEVAKRTEELRGIAAREGEAAAAAREAQTRCEEAEKQADEHRGSGSLAQTLIYLAAGALFILGDVVMARVIVADAFNMAGWEATLFACGLAMVSILIKPAYDRLFEKPYRNGNVRRFAWVICTLAVVSFVTLGVLGAFRSEAYGNSIRMDRVTDTQNMSSAAASEALTKIEDRMLASRLGYASFILSGILFAAAGAVTLSIGFSYADERHHRRAAERAAKDGRKLRDATRTRHDGLRTEATRKRAELERLSALLADAPPLASAEAEADRLYTEWRNLEVRRVETRKYRLRSLYDDGYELGTVMAREAAQAVVLAPASEERPRRRRPRPFVALRRVIREAALHPPTLN